MKIKSVIVLGLALFSLFFGAGNLILPPQLGLRAGEIWWLVCLGFTLSAVLVPMLGILAHARLQGSMFDFARKVSPGFSIVYCYLVYAISVCLPSPRTASVTHEMAIAPYFGTSYLLSSVVYFGLVFLFVLNRKKLGGIIGKWLTPVILIVLVLLIGNMLLQTLEPAQENRFANPFSAGLLEGYQTFDAIGAVVVGGVILISLRLEAPGLKFGQRFRAIVWAGALATGALLLLYAGLMYSGSLMDGRLPAEATRTEVLSGLADFSLGQRGGQLLAVLISLACFTTAVGIVTGTADFVGSRFSNSSRAYVVTAALGCALGVLFGQLPVEAIIAVALPALMFIYPLTIVLILLNALPLNWTSPRVFRAVVGITLLFSIPDFLQSTGAGPLPESLVGWIPMREQGLAWFLPAVITWTTGGLVSRAGTGKLQKPDD